MTFPRQSLLSSVTALVATTLLSLTTACGGLSLGRLGGGGGGSTSTPSGGGATESGGAGLDATIFAGLSEDSSKENARTFKNELRKGYLALMFDEGELFAEVAAICGTKIWDQCQVAESPRTNALDWRQWTFKRKDADQLHLYPDMFYAKAEPRWSQQAIEYILRHESAELGPVLVKMTQDKCGTSFIDGCQVRQRRAAGFVLTVRSTGEVIDTRDTLPAWKRDM